MNTINVIDKEKATEIIRKSIKEINNKEKSNLTKAAVVNNIIKMIEQVISDED